MSQALVLREMHGRGTERPHLQLWWERPAANKVPSKRCFYTSPYLQISRFRNRHSRNKRTFLIAYVVKKRSRFWWKLFMFYCTTLQNVMRLRTPQLLYLRITVVFLTSRKIIRQMFSTPGRHSLLSSRMKDAFSWFSIFGFNKKWAFTKMWQFVVQALLGW